MLVTGLVLLGLLVVVVLFEAFAELNEKKGFLRSTLGYVPTISQWTWSVTARYPWLALVALLAGAALVFHLFVQPWILSKAG